MPELRHPLGYPLVLLAMAIMAFFLLFYFRAKGWIFKGNSNPE
jgi:Mg2+ and Co2+ transporter CorA